MKINGNQIASNAGQNVRANAARVTQGTAQPDIDWFGEAGGAVAPVVNVTGGVNEVREQPTVSVSREAIPQVSVQQVASPLQQQPVTQPTMQAESPAQRVPTVEPRDIADASGLGAAHAAIGQPAAPSTTQAVSAETAQPAHNLTPESRRERVTSGVDAAMAGNELAQRGYEAAVARTEAREQESEETGKPVAPKSDRERIRDAEKRRAQRENIADMSLKQSQVPMTENDMPASPLNSPLGFNPIDRVLRFAKGFNRRPAPVEKVEKDRAAARFKNKEPGQGIYGKIKGLRTLDFDEVGLGIEEILAAKEQNAAHLQALLQPYITDGMTQDVEAMTSTELANLINNNRIYVGTFKPPDNQGEDMQRRRLRILTQQRRGIYLHNLMAAMYTADYDGDDMGISFDPVAIEMTKDPMDHLVNIFGKLTLNADFLPVAKIVPLGKMSVRDYIRETILMDYLTSPRTGDKVDGRTMAPLIDAIIDLSKCMGDEVGDGYAKVVIEARRFADTLAGRDDALRSRDRAAIDNAHELSNRYMDDIVRNVFDSMRQTMYYNTLTTIGADNSNVPIELDNIPEPRTYDDMVLYNLVDDMVKGQIPNNFQEMKLMLTGYLGNAKGKNAPFRFTADVGKMMKLDERLRVGNEYVVDFEDNWQAECFFRTTSKMAASLKMARDIKHAGRSEYYTQVMRESVLREVGFPEDPRYDGRFGAFMEAFARSYNRNSAIINQANMVYLTNMGLSTNASNGLVSPIEPSKGGLRIGDLAEPILSIYGKFTVERVFNLLVSSGAMREDARDDFFAGNPRARKRDNKQENEYNYRYQDRFWITGQYMTYSLRRFRNENRIIRGETGIEEINSSLVKEIDKRQSSVDSQFDLLLTIADKRTGAASKYNKSVYGMTEKAHSPYERTTVNLMSTMLTSIKNSLREGGTVIAPGYYAGIGTRDVESMTELQRRVVGDVATRLSNMGWVLRSGDAKGMDQMFQAAAGQNSIIYKASKTARLSNVAYGHVVNFDEMTAEEQRVAHSSVMRLHGNPDKLNDYAKSLMARNYYQVVGSGGTADSAFVACYAPETGGTQQAIRLAHERGIPVFNLAEYEDPAEWAGDVIDAATKASMGQLRTDDVRHDQAIDVRDAVNALIMSNPDLFTHFNMDSTESFLQSSWGKKMLEHADNPEILGGIYTSMVFEYRMDRVFSTRDEVVEQDTVERFEEAWNDFLLAKDEVSSLSEVWHGIMREIEAEESVSEQSYFQMTRLGTQLKQYAVDGFSYRWNAIRDAKEFWKDPGNHMTLMDVISDLDMERSTKWNVIADVVRYWENDLGLKSYEVGYQMEIANDSSYSIGGAPDVGPTKVHHEFEEAFNGWAKRSQARLRDDVDQAYRMYGHTKNALMDTLRWLDENPWELVSIDDGMFADAVLAVYDKEYAQTEKSKQHPWSNSVYQALTMQRVGTYQNDIAKMDDRLLGVVSWDSICVQDVIHLLADPNSELTVYDGRNISVLTRDSLLAAELGDGMSLDVEDNIWQFLLREPRIASMVRSHAACVKTDADGNGYVGASNSMTETISNASERSYDPVGKVKYLFRNDPVYAGVIALATPGVGLVTRTARERIRETEDFLAYELYAAASTDWDETEIAKVVLNDLGIDQENLRRQMMSKFDKYLAESGQLGDEDLESDAEADAIYAEVYGRVVHYIKEIRDSGTPLGIEVDEPNMLKRLLSLERVASEETAAPIREFRGENAFLSNFYPTPVTYEGITYDNAEAAFQAQKTLDEEERRRFVGLDGKSAKRLGRQISLRSDWDSVKEDVMRGVIHAKFSRPDMREMLDMTGNAELIEGNAWNDTTWGVHNGVGRNLLGKILMEERGDGYDWLGPDAASMAAFWDVVQELSGAKTARSTGVEGSETYKFSKWVSHMRSRDMYADIQALPSDDMDGRWDQAWTSLTNYDDTPVVLNVDEGGRASIIMEQLNDRNQPEAVEYFVSPNEGEPSLVDAKEAAKVDEIVVMVPEGYLVKDRSMDTYGTQVQSLQACFVSKRSNGAESFNLKAKKAGIDGKYSITKELPGGRVRGDGKTYTQLLVELRDIAANQGERYAKLELARQMLAVNTELGYDDLTLSNYMSIAELMFVLGDDGNYYLRSIEMLVAAVKERLGWNTADMSDSQLCKAIMEVVKDTSETGVGMSVSANPLDMLDGVRPASRSSQHQAIRNSSSLFARNYDLLGRISKDARKKGVEPMSQARAEQLDNRFAPYKKLYDGEYGGYKVVGAVSPGTDNLGPVNKIYWTVGPSNAILLDRMTNMTAGEMANIFNQAWEYGMTVIVGNPYALDLVPTWAIRDAVPFGEGGALFPLFDMRLNGSEATPRKGRFAIGQVPFSSYTVSAEDSTNEFGLGDAEAICTEDYAGRIQKHDSGTQQINADELFPNVIGNPAYKNCHFTIGLASVRTVKKYVIDGEPCMIDYGVTEGGRGWDQRRHDVDKAIKKFRENWAQANPDGYMMGIDCKPGDIVAWADLAIEDPWGGVSHTLAPIIPFQLHNAKRQPSKFSVGNIGPISGSRSFIEVCWENVTKVTEGLLKYFDNSGGANKGMLDLTDTIKDQRILADGTKLDVYIAKPSTNSRKVGTDRRIKTMISLMTLARMHGYNFARRDGEPNPDAFPENPDIRDRLLVERIGSSEWKQLLDGNIRFTTDERLNSFLAYESRKILENGGNPSDYLANMYEDPNYGMHNTHVMWEFEAMFDQGLNYEDCLLRFLSFMDPELCPSGIEDATEDCHFRLYKEAGKDGSPEIAKGYDTGVLQMRVPHRMADGTTKYLWDNVYIGLSFFGEEYSGFSRPNVEGSSNYLDAANTAAMYGKGLDARGTKTSTEWALSGIGRMYHGLGSYGIPADQDDEEE